MNEIGKDADTMLSKRIERDFKYHPPKPESVPKFTAIRDSAKDLALIIAALTPGSREQSLALSRLEEAVMWANAAIARNQEP